MKIKVDLDNDTLYFRISEVPIEASEEVNDGIILDYDMDGKFVGIEILRLKERFKLEYLTNLKVEILTIMPSA